NLKVFIQAARTRREALDHCLFYSPPGLGKTTLSHILAREMGVNIKVTSGPVLSKPGDLAAMLTTELSEGDILFIDEIHRLNAAVEEALYPVMEDFLFFINTGQGPGSTTLKLAVPRFTLVGATTRSGLLTGPLRDRFGIVFNLGFYGEAEITQILVRSAGIFGSKAERAALELIAKRSRGTPRIANRLLRRVRDFADVKSDGVITAEITQAAMTALEIDPEGLDDLDRRILLVIAEKFNGGPVGIETIAVAVSEETDTLTDVIEPFLIQSGFLKRTPRGRMLTPKAARHLGLKLGLVKE
ncbi:MAG: Holliday junction branch migration DNA helicase RuvB, partial [Elusimicrobia bacterium CG08_land_8_20_14_0_20_59_10]